MASGRGDEVAAASLCEACVSVSLSEPKPNFAGESNGRQGHARTTAVAKHSIGDRALIASATAVSLSSSAPENGSVTRNQRERDEADL